MHPLNRTGVLCHLMKSKLQLYTISEWLMQMRRGVASPPMNCVILGMYLLCSGDNHSMCHMR